MLRFIFDGGEFWDRALHAECHFVLSNAGSNLWVVDAFIELAVESVDLVDELALGGLTDTVRVTDVVNGASF